MDEDFQKRVKDIGGKTNKKIWGGKEHSFRRSKETTFPWIPGVRRVLIRGIPSPRGGLIPAEVPRKGPGARGSMCIVGNQNKILWHLSANLLFDSNSMISF